MGVLIDSGILIEHERGRLIGPNDLWLAASCLAHGFSFITANERELGRSGAGLGMGELASLS